MCDNVCKDSIKRTPGTRVKIYLNARAEFAEDYQIQDERSGQQWIFARVVDDQCIVATHHDLASVLVHGAFAVSYNLNKKIVNDLKCLSVLTTPTNIRHIFDNNHVVWMLIFLVQNSIRKNHVVDNITFGNLKKIYNICGLAIQIAYD